MRTRALLVRAASDDLRVWVNGHLVADDDPYAEFEETPRVTEIDLAAGWNRILVKTRRPFWIRLADVEGAPLVLASGSAAQLEPVSSEDDPRVDSGGALPDWRTELAPADSPRADFHLGLALLAMDRGREDIAVESAQKALDLAPEEAAVLYHAGRVLQRSTYLPSTLSKNRAQVAYAAAVEKDPGFLPAYERLAYYLADDKKFAEAVERMRSALDRSPDFLRGLVRLKAVCRQAGWKEEEIAAVREIERAAPGSIEAPLFWAGHYSGRGNPDAAAKEYEKVVALDATQLQVLGTLADLATERGDAPAAEAHLRSWLEKAPESRTAHEEWIDFLSDQERFDEALEVAGGLRGRHPQDPRWPLRAASLLERVGRDAEALAQYRAALVLEPGQLDLRRFLAVRRGTKDRFWEPYDERLEDWTEKVPTSGPLVEKAASIAILDIGVLRLEKDGSSTSYVHQAFKLLTEESKEALARVQTPGEIVTLRTVTPDGDVLEPVPATGKTQYVMPGLSPGAVIEFAYRSDSAERRGQPHREERFFFQDPGFGQSFLLSRYVVLIEPGAEIEFDETRLDPTPSGGLGRAEGEPAFARVEKTERRLEDGTRVVTYEARHAPRLESEPLQPATEEYVPNVRVVDATDWNGVTSTLRRINRGKTRPTAELRAVAAEVAGGIDSPVEKARALYRHVNELVPSGRGSSRATRVLLEKAGDRTALFKALLDIAGVSSQWAYLRPPENLLPHTDWSYPSTDKFPYRHVAVEDEDGTLHFVSLTSRTVPFGLLPEYLFGGRALLLEDGRIVGLPGLQVESVATSLVVRMELSGGTGGEVDMKLISRAARGFTQKERFRTIQGFQKNVMLQGIANRYFPGARLKEGAFVGIDDDVTPFTLHVKLTAPRLLRPGDGVLLLKALPQPSMMVRTFGGTRDRQHPFHLRASRISDDNVEIQLPAGYRLERAPRGVVLATALGDYSLTYEHAGDSVRVRRRLAILPGRLAPEDYPAFVDFCERVDAAETENLVLRRISENEESN